jgi:methyl-accepting chemotaxis protein
MEISVSSFLPIQHNWVEIYLKKPPYNSSFKVRVRVSGSKMGWRIGSLAMVHWFVVRIPIPCGFSSLSRVGPRSCSLHYYRQLLYALLLLGVIVPVVMTAYGVRHITEPIQKLIRASEQVTAGEFKHQIDVNTGDEIETLANQFNLMSAILDDYYSSLEKVATALGSWRF